MTISAWKLVWIIPLTMLLTLTFTFGGLEHYLQYHSGALFKAFAAWYGVPIGIGATLHFILKTIENWITPLQPQDDNGDTGDGLDHSGT